MSDYKRRKRGIRKPRKILVIVCEGEKTEKQYFDGFKERYSGVRIETMHGNCTDPKNIVKFAIEQKREYSLDFNNGDGIWCVFDVDDSSNQKIRCAVELAQSRDIQIAMSNPCFELWFLIHFIYICSPLTRSDAKRRLKEYIPNYKKNLDVYDILRDKLPTAENHATRLNTMHERARIQIFSRESTPSSQVFKLIDYIRKITERNRNNL